MLSVCCEANDEILVIIGGFNIESFVEEYKARGDGFLGDENDEYGEDSRNGDRSELSILFFSLISDSQFLKFSSDSSVFSCVVSTLPLLSC